MARNIEQIYNEMVLEAKRLSAELNNQQLLLVFENKSRVAIWKILFYAIAFGIWSFEKVFDNAIEFIQDIVEKKAPHNLRWYRFKALSFQYTFTLLNDSDKFDNSNASEAEIEESKVVVFAAINETLVDGENVILIKIARFLNGDLAQLLPEQEAAFRAYMDEVKDAGNRLVIYNRQADALRVEVEVYYNPLILSANGFRLDGEGKPVEEAAVSFLKSLPPNGEFSVASFCDSLQAAYGVSNRNVFVRKVERKIGSGEWQAVSTTFIPDAGYMRFDENGLNVVYTGYVHN